MLLRFIHEYCFSGLKDSVSRNNRVNVEFSAAMECMSALLLYIPYSALSPSVGTEPVTEPCPELVETQLRHSMMHVPCNSRKRPSNLHLSRLDKVDIHHIPPLPPYFRSASKITNLPP
jgi:hypothetical protein